MDGLLLLLCANDGVIVFARNRTVGRFPNGLFAFYFNFENNRSPTQSCSASIYSYISSEQFSSVWLRELTRSLHVCNLSYRAAIADFLLHSSYKIRVEVREKKRIYSFDKFVKKAGKEAKWGSKITKR